jgi:pimeloyl-ACP methyl ester carboxylesterase
MILRAEEVLQAVEGNDPRCFIKELVCARGPEPLAMVRKRLPAEHAPPGGYHAPVILLHGFGQNRYAWHLSGRSFANYLAREGFDVFNLDLRGHGRSRRLGARSSRNIDEYVGEDLPAAVDEVLTLTGRTQLFVLGHSLGGLIAYSAAPELGESVAGIVAIGSPYHFAKGSVTLAVASRLVGLLSDHGLLKATPGRLPIQLVGRWMHLYRGAWDSRLVPLPLRAWAPGALEARLLEEYLLRSFDSASIGTLVQLARLAVTGTLRSLDGRIDYATAFEQCSVPLLVIAGAHDLLAPPSTVRPAYDRAASPDKTYRVLPGGHADLLVGRDAPATTWPLVSTWLQARAARRQPAAPAPLPGAESR